MAASDTRNYTMAGEVAAEILSQKLEILLYHPMCVGCLSTEKLVKDAKGKLATIQEFFSIQDRPPKSMEWLGRLLRAMYDAEEFIDKFHLSEARGRYEVLHVATWPAAALISKCKLWKDLSNLVNKMQELCQDQYLTGKEAEGKTEKVPASPLSPASVQWQGQKKVRLTSFWYPQTSNFLCHKIERKKIMDKIGKEKEFILEVTTISGEQGTGKTFLARWVYREAVYLGVESRAWVHLSASMDTKEFLVEILKQLGKLAREVKDMNSNEIGDMLFNELVKKKKKFLIVLDDVIPSNVRLVQKLLGITLFLVKGHIIITTRHDRVAAILNFSDTGGIKLETLKDDKSLEMLAWKSRRVHESHLKEEDILKTCRGLPLHLSLVGGLLSYAEEHELTSLVKDRSTSDILQLSYHRLPVHLKPCFIYMALFPVEFPIPTRRLVRLWLAEGLLDSHCYNGERKRTGLPEDVGETFILELVDRNLIDVVSWRADGSPKACQMLTSLYEMIRPIATSMGFLHIHDASKSKGGNDGDPTGQQQQAQPRETKVRWLVEHTNIVRDGQVGSNPNLNLGHVRSFLSFYLRRGMLSKDISMVLGSITSKTDYSLLRVLDLEGVYKPSLQSVLHKLVLLRYLGLRSTVLDSIPSAVADLHHIETLDIKHTNITSLPSSLWKARNLRHLHLNWFYIDLKKILKACSNNVMALTKLQTLSGLVIGQVKENSMKGPMNILTTLTKLKLFLQHSDKDTSGPPGKAVADWISLRLTNLQSLTFGVIQEPKPVEEAKPKRKPRKVAQPAREAEPEKDAKRPKEATKGAKPNKRAPKVPATSQIGPLPELSLTQHHELLELYLLGQLNNPIWTRLLPESLRVLTLSGSTLKTDMMRQLGNLLRQLRTLRLLANSFLGTRLEFAKDGFPSLNILKIWNLPRLREVIIQSGAMTHLKELEFRHLDMMQNVQGIDHCMELEIICVISQSGASNFVNKPKDTNGKETILCIEEDSKGSESMDNDDDEDNRDEKEDTPDLHVGKDSERAESEDEDDSDDDNEATASP